MDTLAIDFRVPWHLVTDEQSLAAWKRELEREVCPSHVLYGRDATFIARRQDRDDFLVSLEGGQVAIVHLTWSKETDPRWPATWIYENIDEWVHREMLPDAEEWEG